MKITDRADSTQNFRPQIPLRIREGIRHGDEAAFAEYYEGVQSQLVTFLERLTGDADEALNIAHDAFIKLWENRDRIDQLNGFIYTTASNGALDMLRRKSVHSRYSDEQMFVHGGDSYSGDSEMASREMELLIGQTIEKMPPQRRKVFEMSRDENMTYNEIADRLNISYNGVKKHIQLALNDLRSVLTALAAIFVFG